MGEATEYIRQLECHELDQRCQADERIAVFVNTDDLEALDALCLKASGVIAQQQYFDYEAALSKAMIRDLTICLGDILTRYLRGNWTIYGRQTDESEHPYEAWALMLHSDEGHLSLHLEDYVTDRFNREDGRTFDQFVESCICQLQHIPGVYLGGYGPINHDH
ncbi:MAG: hypothetical protein L0H44_11535 [Yaniella sp.]|nr:hypothetical protein [Yaniella sp.]MDN6152038.1 hypothetical protein [Yaniella sp.]MDN6459139.1 hypothetical protein [Bifidobacterium crudilactis]